jgi:hypothetical protein
MGIVSIASIQTCPRKSDGKSYCVGLPTSFVEEGNKIRNFPDFNR